MNYQNKILILFVSWWLIELKKVLYLIRKLKIYCKIVIIIIHFMQILPESDIRWRKSQRTYQIHFKDARNLTRFTSYLQSFFSYRHVLYIFRKLKTFQKDLILCKITKNWYPRCYGPGKMPYSNFIRGASSWKLKYPKNQV